MRHALLSLSQFTQFLLSLHALAQPSQPAIPQLFNPPAAKKQKQDVHRFIFLYRQKAASRH